MTLIELTAVMSILSVLAEAMMSAVLIAAHAMPEQNQAASDTTAAMDALDQLADELTYATSVTTLSATEIVFTVADRGHGAAGPETIRYAWSGPGAPLRRQYNGGVLHSVVESADGFSITAFPAVRPLAAAPRVLLIVTTAATQSLTPNESSRRNLLESWGFSVSLMTGDQVATNLSSVVATTDVVYVPADVNLMAPGAADVRVGVVIESCAVNAALGISSDCTTTPSGAMTVEDDEHEILSVFELGEALSLTVSAQPLTQIVSPPASADVLGRLSGSRIVLVGYEIGSKLTTGAAAKARRVRLPWGLNATAPFPIAQLTENGRTILRRGLVWASANPVIPRVRIGIQPSGTATAMETEVMLLNQPRDPRP